MAVHTLREGCSDSQRLSFLAEALTLGQFDHSHIVRLEGVVTRGRPGTLHSQCLARYQVGCPERPGATLCHFHLSDSGWLLSRGGHADPIPLVFGEWITVPLNDLSHLTPCSSDFVSVPLWTVYLFLFFFFKPPHQDEWAWDRVGGGGAGWVARLENLGFTSGCFS